MSNRRKINRPRPAPADLVAALFARIEAERIPGGCPDCNAYQQMFRDEPTGIFTLRVCHDETCPFLLQRRAGGDR